MLSGTPRAFLLFALLLFALVAPITMGCQGRSSEEPSTDETIVPGMSDAVDKRKAVAEKAKDALQMRLSGRLMEVMQAEGPAAAINVCSEQAVAIAEAIGEEHGVTIGRTSFKLRNPDNAPREWVKPFVENRSDTPQHVSLDDGSLGSLYPIRLSVKCLMCHGGPDDILDAVKPELAKRYPNDAATGFQLDDLRGWFWVEVPVSDTNGKAM